MQYQKPNLQPAGEASRLIQTKAIPGMDHSSTTLHTETLISALEVD